MKRAVLFDLDDTLIFAYANPAPAWHAVVREFAEGLAGHDPGAVATVIADSTASFLSDDDNRRRWRLQAVATRRSVVRNAVLSAGFTGLDTVADAIADRYAAYREENMYLYPDALAVIDTFRARGLKLGLVTNGATEVQNAKIDRFGLRHRFDHIQVEEEAGFGKPDGRAYVHTLAALAVDPQDAGMIGDDLVWDVLAPQRLGMTGIWYDPFGIGLSADAPVVPDRRILRLTEVLDA
ncbi:putative hydrolase of the HAD superfamily [Devosia enhydra]|uniref:Putative hydrolase of the HAD superfamily n=1 Tax=Devosia enhydra TaxID=665118 RepID=A0A1K2HUH1_9HYPH|nr:HAD family hydrolase [Devosia enhydra]SFZ81896.1 putative hydrolase of the HAD superfamily [Devosia enhydra]